MYLNSKKLRLIEYILSLKEEKLVDDIENIISNIQDVQYKETLGSDFVKESTMTYNSKEKETIVGFTIEGKPLTKADLIARSLQSEKDFREGKYITLEDLEKESESW